MHCTLVQQFSSFLAMRSLCAFKNYQVPQKDFIYLGYIVLEITTEKNLNR